MGRCASFFLVMKITLLSSGAFRVETGVFMSNGTYQKGDCTLAGNVLRFAGAMNHLPFRVNLGPVSLAKVLSMKTGDVLSF